MTDVTEYRSHQALSDQFRSRLITVRYPTTELNTPRYRYVTAGTENLSRNPR